jgi:hypothetical protein
MADIFYVLEKVNAKKIKEIFREANKESLETDLSYQPLHNIGRQRADKDFDTLIDAINYESLKHKFITHHFRIILRKEMNLFGIISDKKERKDILEIFIDNIYLDNEKEEYSIFMYLDKAYLSKLKEKYDLREL